MLDCMSCWQVYVQMYIDSNKLPLVCMYSRVVFLPWLALKQPRYHCNSHEYWLFGLMQLVSSEQMLIRMLMLLLVQQICVMCVPLVLLYVG
jgi:hypothetical protein